MPMETYRLEVRENKAMGIEADVYGSDDLIEDSVHIAYEDYDLEPPDSRDEQPFNSEEVTADVTTLDLQVERTGGGFSFRVLGDRDELTAVRIDDEDWDLN